DVSMVEGSASLMHMMYAFMAAGHWQDKRGVNLLDGGAYFYDSYETQDQKYITLGALQPQFYQLMREKMALDSSEYDDQNNVENWPALIIKIAAIVKTKTREQWCELLEGSDVCFAPVLSMGEAPEHPHNQYRKSFYTHEGVVQPSPAPKFS